MISKERITRKIDECECDGCGCPLAVHDRVYYRLEWGAAYCSPSCAAADEVAQRYGPHAVGQSDEIDGAA